MQPYIGRWKCRYRMLDAQPQAALAIEAIERRVRQRALEVYDATVSAALENDPAVYVFRRVEASVSLHVGSSSDEAALARNWGASIGKEIVRGLHSNNDSSNIIRFADDADYIAHFFADLLADLAWQARCYGAFSKYRLATKQEAVLALLCENPKLVPGIFRHLAGLGCLKAVLDLLDPDAAATLWRKSIAPQTRAPDRSQFHVFAGAAVAIASALELWSAAPVNQEELLDAYLATQPQAPDWTDRRSLAFAVWSILRFAGRKGFITAGGATEEKLSTRFATLAASLDWLDVGWLENALASWSQELAGPLSYSPQSIGIAKATLNQQRLLERLRAILGAAVIGLDQQEPDSESNAVRLFALLAAAEPESASHPATAAIISLMLACWKAILQLDDPRSAVMQIRSGQAPVGWAELPTKSGESLRAAAALGEPIADVLQELVFRNPVRLRTRIEGNIDTRCAGLFLLVRALTDARMPQMIERTNPGQVKAVLLALGLMWAGPRCVQAGIADPGLAFWSGLNDRPQSIAAILGNLHPAGCESLLAGLEKLVKDRSSLDPDLLITTDVPPEWTISLAESWPQGVPSHPSLVLASIHVLRMWARWLRGVSKSGIPYLLTNLVRRSGRIEVSPDRICVKMSPAPLDAVLKMSGYLDETPAIPWLGDRSLLFRVVRNFE